MKVLIIFIASLVAVVITAPVNNEQLDKANENNPYVNDVIANNKAKLQEVAVRQVDETTQINLQKEFNPKPAGTAFVRLIDDIFQIPIGVLQSVAKLLTNPFKQILHPSEGSSPEASKSA